MESSSGVISKMNPVSKSIFFVYRRNHVLMNNIKNNFPKRSFERSMAQLAFLQQNFIKENRKVFIYERGFFPATN